MDTHDVVLELWDYFYISNVPRRGDEKVWGVIERATCRIREVSGVLHTQMALDVRLRHARRLRASVRAATRGIDRLSVAPAPWVIHCLADLDALASALIDEVSADARLIVLH